MHLKRKHVYNRLNYSQNDHNSWQMHIAFNDDGGHGPVISLWRRIMPKEEENLSNYSFVKQARPLSTKTVLPMNL
jgi:hypothetical protein